MMDFIKKYLTYGIYILVILVSIGIYVWSLMINGQNVKDYSSIETQYNTAINLGTKAVADNVIQFYKDNYQLAEDDKKAVLDFCRSTSSRPFLEKRVFPFAPQDVSKQYYTSFASEYCKAVENYMSVMHGGDKPSALEEQSYLESAKRTTTGNNAGGGAVAYDPRAGGGGMTTTGSADEKLLIEFREKRAQEISVYANLDTFVLYNFWQEHDGSSGTTASLQSDSWYSQIAHWIQEDVVLSVTKMNPLTKPVTQNPVKRLIEISFSGNQATSGVGTAGGGRGGVANFGDPRRTMASGRSIGTGSIDVASRAGNSSLLPGILTKSESSDSTAAMTIAMGQSAAEMAKPWTNHYSDDITDVFHFSTSVIVSSNMVNEFINALQSARANADGSNSRNQITVLQFNVQPINLQAEENAGYYYGGGSLVKANFICEYVFFKSGYDKMIPDSVKTNTVTTAGM